MNRAIALLVGSGILLTIFVLESEGGPVSLNGKPKPPNCPYGQCFIDRCIRICSCLPPEGNISCTNNLNRSSMECSHPGGTDNCPLGETYKSPIWADNFLCYCNNDASQTYECFDLSTKKSADARALIRNNSKIAQIIARSTESSIQKLKIH